MRAYAWALALPVAGVALVWASFDRVLAHLIPIEPVDFEAISDLIAAAEAEGGLEETTAGR